MGGFTTAPLPAWKSRNPTASASPRTMITLSAELAVARDLEPDFTVNVWDFRTTLNSRRRLVVPRVPAYAVALGCTVVYGFGVVLADLGTAPPYDRSAQNMGNGVPCYPRTKGSHSERVFSAFAVPSGYSPGPQGAWPTSATRRPRSGTGRRPNHGFGTTDPTA